MHTAGALQREHVKAGAFRHARRNDRHDRPHGNGLRHLEPPAALVQKHADVTRAAHERRVWSPFAVEVGPDKVMHRGRRREWAHRRERTVRVVPEHHRSTRIRRDHEIEIAVQIDVRPPHAMHRRAVESGRADDRRIDREKPTVFGLVEDDEAGRGGHDEICAEVVGDVDTGNRTGGRGQHPAIANPHTIGPSRHHARRFAGQSDGHHVIGATPHRPGCHRYSKVGVGGRTRGRRHGDQGRHRRTGLRAKVGERTLIRNLGEQHILQEDGSERRGRHVRTANSVTQCGETLLRFSRPRGGSTGETGRCAARRRGVAPPRSDARPLNLRGEIIGGRGQ